MSLRFPANTDYVDCGSAASLDDIEAGTIVAWVKVSASTVNQRITSKGGTTLLITGAELPRFIRTRATTALEVIGTAALATSGWVCVAVRWDSAGVDADQQLYTGDLGTALAEVGAYTTQTVGSGATTSDAASNLFIGGSGSSQRWQGDIGEVMLFNRRLSLEEMRQVQFRPVALSGCVLWQRPGYSDATSAQADYSGSGNNGTIGGSPTRADPVPLGAWRRRPARITFAPGATTYQVTLAGGMTPAGGLVRTTTTLVSAGLTPAATLARATVTLLAGAITPGAALATLKVSIVALAGSLTPAGALVRSTTKLLAGTLAPVGAMVRASTKLVSGAATPAGVLTSIKVSIVSLAGALTPAGGLVRHTMTRLAGALTPAGALARSTTRALAGAIAPVGVLIRQATKPLAGGATPSGAMSTLKVSIVSLAGSLTPAGGLVRQVTKGLAGALTPVGALVATIVSVGATILKMTAGVVVRSVYAAGPILAPAIAAAARLKARLRGPTDVGPEA